MVRRLKRFCQPAYLSLNSGPTWWKEIASLAKLSRHTHTHTHMCDGGGLLSPSNKYVNVIDLGFFVLIKKAKTQTSHIPNPPGRVT